ncbi:MAG: hypothetical protein ACTSWY_16045 [Promethearchaeota archaeon]
MTKNLNLKVSESLFYEFHRIKGSLKAGTNQDALLKLLIIADRSLKNIKTKEEKDEFIDSLKAYEKQVLQIAD